MIDPRNMELQDWADSMSFELERLSSGMPPRINGDDWVDWGRRATALLVPNQQNAPDPGAFSTWQEFGVRFQQFLGSNS